MERRIRIKLKIKKSDVDIGYGPGIIADQTLTYNLDEKDYSSLEFHKGLLDHSNNLIREAIVIELEDL